MARKERGIHELYGPDPEAADELLWGRRSDPVTRRGFLAGSGRLAMSAALGAAIPFAHLMPSGLIPAAFAQSNEPFRIPGKDGLIVLNDRPIAVIYTITDFGRSALTVLDQLKIWAESNRI